MEAVLEQDVQLRKQNSPTKRAQTASSKKVKKQTSMTTSSNVIKTSQQYEARGYTELAVNTDHLNAM